MISFITVYTFYYSISSRYTRATRARKHQHRNVAQSALCCCRCSWWSWRVGGTVDWALACSRKEIVRWYRSYIPTASQPRMAGSSRATYWWWWVQPSYSPFQRSTIIKKIPIIRDRTCIAWKYHEIKILCCVVPQRTFICFNTYKWLCRWKLSLLQIM